jgi:uncharacterized phiE125 gp8 family phage protein
MITSNFELITAAATEPIVLADAKEHLNVDLTTHDTLITRAISAARRAAESYLRFQIITATWKLWLDEFPSDEILINKNPVTDITHVKYYDSDNALQTWSSSLYETDLVSKPARLQPISTESYPDVYDRLKAIEIQFVAGYADAASVPEDILNAMYLLIGHMYANRQDVITGTQVRELLKGSHYLMDFHRSYMHL